jgi:CRISPR-associated protein Cmr2
LLETARALKESGFPRSQLYQLRDLLAQGKKTAMLNYRYFRARLDAKTQQLLLNYFERAWCEARTNDGNLAPWTPTKQASTYETIWRDLVDLYNFVELESPIGQAVTLQGEGESPA